MCVSTNVAFRKEFAHMFVLQINYIRSRKLIQLNTLDKCWEQIFACCVALIERHSIVDVRRHYYYYVDTPLN